MSRLASLKEFAFMNALYERDFPTPVPIDANRHGIVMSLVKAYPMTQVRVIPHPDKVYKNMMELVVRLAQHGLVHGDYNEFNMMIDDDEKLTMIDFPQMISTSHANAGFYFDRDVDCVQEYFSKHYGLVFEGKPTLDSSEAQREVDLDQEVRASGFVKE
jgi:RIO kinase 2